MSNKLTYKVLKNTVKLTYNKKDYFVQNQKSLENIFYSEESENISIYDDYGARCQNRLSDVLNCIRETDNFIEIKIKLTFKFKGSWDRMK